MSSIPSTPNADKSWLGGFAESKAAFAYPDPKLTSLPMLDNLANIALLQRQQEVKWPEFSWNTVVGDGDSRCYTMFAPYISRIGYDRTGRVYSIICPQQGMWLGDKLCLNVEVTVTGQRGWVDESSRTMAADMTVEGKIWLSPKQGPLGEVIWNLLESFDNELPLPIDKEHAIRVTTHNPGDPEQPIFPLTSGETDKFPIPDFAKHPEAWAVSNLGVQIGDIVKTHHPMVDELNEMIMEAFNISSGNMLQNGNTLFWNVWFTAPEVVDQNEWRGHAAKWRKSIQAHHGSPDGEGTTPRYFNGDPFTVDTDIKEEMGKKLMAFIAKYKTGHWSEEIEEKVTGFLGEHGKKLSGMFGKLFDRLEG